jgi:hypothetical protein
MVAYPEEFLMADVPVFTIATTLDKVKPGDIVKATSSTYARVEKVENGQIYSVSFGGNVRRNNPITDFLTQQKTVRVVVNPFAMTGASANNNLALLMMLDGKEGGKGDIAEVMMVASMLNGQGSANPFGSMMSNPMALLALSKGSNSGSSLKDIMLLQMIQSNGFNPFAPVATAAPAPVAVAEGPVQ